MTGLRRNERKKSDALDPRGFFFGLLPGSCVVMNVLKAECIFVFCFCVCWVFDNNTTVLR